MLAVHLWGQPLDKVPADALKPGDQAPPLKFEFMLQGPPPGDANLKALHGKVVILDFWGTWCAPCIGLLPHLNELVAHYRKEPVQFIAVGSRKPA
jgi:thiol-disulfide isomerase/thioredoxin